MPNPPNPIVSFSVESKILIIGQAPGAKVQKSGIPFDDKSGQTLRDWLGVTVDEFYNTKNFGIIPMGFCFPGNNPKGGDLPPRPECAPQWHEPIFNLTKEVKLVLLIGSYAQKYYLKKQMKKNLTETVKAYYEYLPNYFPLVHPSPLNFRWHARNKWFQEDIVPELKQKIINTLN
ncbi:uracil-DNA glycosylase family protein [Aquimarina sediminis]|uniref:uracil-DNA glycosylase family protein n=1 Tax=Aquimarina sediminis TaxID=2070536 RepID=UPI001F4E8D2B|nr:uracil-DNA glycosylase family protein [Aquimarina sediminis]